VALGGDTVSGATLTRFYAVHAMLLPALLVAILAFHIFLVRAHGISSEDSDDAADGAAAEPRATETSPAPTERLPGGAAPPAAADASPPAPAEMLASSPADDTPHGPLYRFYPEHAWRSALVFAAALLALIALSIYAEIPREPVAGTLVEDYLPRPEWYYMWLFQLLTYFPGKWEAIGSLAIPFVGVTLLFLLPFLDRSRRRGVRHRPLPLAVGVTAIVGLIYLTAMGFAGAKPYGQVTPVPDRALTSSEQRGLYLYVDRQCAYCHQINGQGGHRVGPDFSNVIAKDRSADYLARYIRNPQSVNRTSIMPKYDLPPADLQALADFILAVGSADETRLVTRQEVLKPDAK
jgi:ubiquinol-cytochrome c reductase cytochrome b subunit